MWDCPAGRRGERRRRVSRPLGSGSQTARDVTSGGDQVEHLSKAIRLDNDRKATLYAHYYLGLVYLEREMYEDAQTFFQKTLALGPNLIEAYYELGRAFWFAGEREHATRAWREGYAANKFNPWGKRCAEVMRAVEAGGEPPRTS